MATIERLRLPRLDLFPDEPASRKPATIQELGEQRTVAEFFAGIGLMRMGLELAGWNVEFANDIDAGKLQFYQGHFGRSDHIICEDVHSLNVNLVPTVTLATASFPCSDLSLAGARLGLKGPQSSALWGFTRILEEMGARKPPLVLLENVPGFLTSHAGQDFYETLASLGRLGYSVDTFILDAANFLPQSRQRLFVVAKLELRNSRYPVPFVSAIRPEQLVNFIREHPELPWSIRTLPRPPASGLNIESILDDLPPDDTHWWSEERATYLLGQMSPRHSEIAQSMISGARWSYGTVFRRMRSGKCAAELRADGIAGCLRTPKGGSGRQILFKAGFNQFFARLITAREAARLMGADEYKIKVPLNEALFGFGDAVCVPVVNWIAENYLNPVLAEMASCARGG